MDNESFGRFANDTTNGSPKKAFHEFELHLKCSPEYLAENSAMATQERQLEEQFIAKLIGLRYEYREDIRDRIALEQNFRAKFETLNRVKLTQGEFPPLLEEIISPDVFTAALVRRIRSEDYADKRKAKYGDQSRTLHFSAN